ncbi:hypothetical protein JMJ35_005528 [Cladonia borealis]|uniref:PHD-type domain-containing protein n=1 Tax=Cladonia borealis TaxID=184061 RepID=A0AA39V8D0_9LECA|nr:hypothetical protein JMJ35_005528 [Cladonia borealis]
MNAPRDTATSSQEQDTNRSGQSPQQPPAGPYNAPEDELLSVGDGEHDSENEGEWPCICGDGLNTDGMWIRCEKSNCPFTWYHIACVGLEEAPAGKWYCPQCRARTREISKAKLGPKKKGTAVKAPQKKEQVRWKGWKELPSDEEEQFKQNVESLWAAQIIPGKTRRGPRQDAPCSEDESESTGKGKSPRQQLRMDISKQFTGKTQTRGPLDTLYSEDGSKSTGERKSPHQQLRMDRCKQSTGNRAYLGPPHNRDSEPSLQSESSNDDQTAWMSELIVGPKDMTIDDRAASPGEDESGSTDWETVMDGDDRAASPGEDESESTDRDTVMEVDDIANYIIDTALGSDLVSDDDSVGSTTTGEGIDLEPTAGDQALVAALKGNWVDQYLA